MRTPIVAGNWKMNNTVAQARQLAAEIVAGVGEPGVTVILAPPYTALAAVAEVVCGSGVLVAAQDMYWAEAGARTGAISPVMVRELASHVILGHSERRQYFGETDEEVNRKVHAAFAHGLVPIVCVGETAAEREAGQADEVVSGQVASALEGLAATEVAAAVLAYEPVWAIGTGQACHAAEAGRMIGSIRQWIAAAFGAEAAEGIRLLYGGSVNPANFASYQASEAIDGALVGGASLEAATFLELVRTAARIAERSREQ